MADLRRETYEAFRRGELDVARARAEKGRAMAAEAGQEGWEWTFRVAHAEVLATQRKDAEAIELLEDGLAKNRALDDVRVRALMTRGLSRCRSSDSDAAFERAKTDLDEASRIAAALSSDELVGEVSLRHGTCLVYRKDLERAEVLFRETLEVAKRERLAVLEANASGSLGHVRIVTNRYDEATEWLRRSLAITTAIKADVPRTKNLQNLGWCYYKLGDFDRAIPFLVEAESLAEKRQLNSERMQSLIILGNIYFQQREFDQAKAQFSRGLSVARELGDPAVTAQFLTNLGLLAMEQARYDEAESLLVEVVRIRAGLKDESRRVNAVLNQAHVWAAHGAPAKADAAYRQVLASPASDGEMTWEAHSGLALLHVQAGRTADAEAEFRAAFDVMERSRDSLHVAEHRLAFYSSLRRFHNEHIDFLVGTGSTDEALVVADRGRARLLAENLKPRGQEAKSEIARYRELAASLDAVLLFYWTAPRRSFAWVVTPTEVVLRTLPGEAAITEKVQAYEARIQHSRDPVNEDSADGEWLYRTLIGPIEEKVPPGRRVVLVPDGPLQQLNFETLVVPGARRHYWIEDVTLATAPSIGLLSEKAGDGKAGDRSILLIGDPISPSSEFPALPFASREMKGIASLFEPARRVVRSGAEAVPTSYKAAEPGRFSYIHFAAHATANRESPLESAVVLSTRGESYKLYARDIGAVPLTAELVTLSACRSAGSRAYSGEGLVGLAWSFLGSGARNVVGGLWNVEDASTAELMEHLYGGLRDGLDPIAALRAAKLRLLRSASAYRKPFYWAPFVVYTRGG
jgi:CHAT domain-containing protein/tetratricopeptide (TPR) repeat protein